ncbi:MAG: hypothetical protein IPH58_12075 [Sphingobacteriales bacterium]|nr:hypothetical protein [Sphingobacteriales bacterium]
MLEQSVIQLLLPEGLLEYFDIIEVKQLCRIKDKQTFYELHLEEQNRLHSGYNAVDFESKGFTEVTIQDFPLRGKDVFLVIRRRRWRHKQDAKQIVRNDCTISLPKAQINQRACGFLKVQVDTREDTITNICS